ncbi:MAG: energy-coupling factor transporter transmembrane protein EcfT [Kastovskya adunca ATA6-11-RM4]|jgi:energy-coupling factor transport system permease protein|nr:energy-coupling factor transporter transmembrane protein EcfT [Kastovskya adunca ATA6-11-RM4]
MTSSRVPTLYRDRDTVIHDRDPRVKIFLLILLFFYIFLAPTWEWMLVVTILGLILAVAAHTPWKWVLMFWAIHIPTFLALIIIPAGGELLAGNFGALVETASAEFRLILAWTAAIIISVSLLSTIDAESLTDGMRGLYFPPVVAFAVGLSYRLLYVTLGEAFRIADAMKIKGVDLSLKRPFRFLWNSLRISFPVLFAVLRRGPTLMSSLAMRGYQTKRPNLGGFDFGDWALLLFALALFALALGAKFGWLPFSLSSLIPL